MKDDVVPSIMAGSPHPGESRGGRAWGLSGKSILVPGAIFTAFAILFTWPLVLRLGSTVAGRVGDNFYYVWLIGWFDKALFSLHQNPFVVPFLNYPDGWQLAYTETTLSNVALALPVSLISGPVAAYNVVVLASFVLSGLMVYAWVIDMTGSMAAALLAGTFFAFTPYRLAHLNGHLPLLGTQWLAMHYLGLYRLLRHPTFSWKWSAVTAIGYGLASLSSAYYMYMTLVVSAGFVGAYGLLADHGLLRRPSFWRNVAMAGLVSVPFGLLAAFPYLSLARVDPNRQPFEEAFFWSASPTDFVVPSPQHSLWGIWIPDSFYRGRWPEQGIYLGAVTLALSAVALLASRRDLGTGRIVRVLVLSGAIAMILAMGLILHWLGSPVLIDPPPLLQRWWITSQGFIPLPGYLLYRLLPFYDNMRVWMRYGIYASLFASACAGIGFTFVVRRLCQRWGEMAFLTLALAATVLDYHTKLSFYTVEPRPVDRWLAGQALQGGVIEFPIQEWYEPVVVLGTLVHGKPTLDTFYGGYYPRNFKEILPALKAFPSERSMEVLRNRRAEIVILDGERLPELVEMRQRVEDLGLFYVGCLGQKYIYRMPGYSSSFPSGQDLPSECP